MFLTANAIANNNVLVDRRNIVSRRNYSHLTGTARVAFFAFIVRPNYQFISPSLVVFSTEPYKFLYNFVMIKSTDDKLDKKQILNKNL